MLITHIHIHIRIYTHNVQILYHKDDKSWYKSREIIIMCKHQHPPCQSIHQTHTYIYIHPKAIARNIPPLSVISHFRNLNRLNDSLEKRNEYR